MNDTNSWATQVTSIIKDQGIHTKNHIFNWYNVEALNGCNLLACSELA